MLRPAWLATTIALALAPRPAPCDDAIRCGGGLVSLGDSKLDLLGKCGEPAFRESKIEERGTFASGGGARASAGEQVAVAVERWTYDFGPQRFVGIVTITMGSVTGVAHGERGRSPDGPGPAKPPIPRANCDYHGFREGDRAWDVLSRCSEPALRERGERTQTVAVEEGGGRRTDGGSGGRGGARRAVVSSTTVAVERWSYDFGPNVFVRHLELVDGVVVSVSTGGHGYSQR